ncbi:MAG: DUF420 domain-containing protein [Verrucomicrobiota bacterium]|nr:DUF420 domain-containing protein [Verrucomicrobiota bacterium]
MIPLTSLPAVNACLNSLSAILLLAGYIFIRQKKQDLHKKCMVGAFITSALFLVCYLYYHYHARTTTFQNPAWFRPYYLAILLTHTILAVAVLPLILMTFFRAFKGRFESHRKIARWTWPIWMYVSVTGVLIYFLLYQIFPQR